MIDHMCMHAIDMAHASDGAEPWAAHSVIPG
jgi:hypothetical protein